MRIAGRVTVRPNKKGREGRDDGEIGYKIIRDYYDLIAFTSLQLNILLNIEDIYYSSFLKRSL